MNININEETLSRIVLIDETGIVYERRNLQVELSVQDNGRTLKVYVKTLNSKGLTN